MNEPAIEKLNEPISLILFLSGENLSHFGGTTHVNSLLPFFKTQQNLKVTIIKVEAEEEKEVSFCADNGLDILTIPKPENKLKLSAENTVNQKTYARCLSEIICQYIPEQKNMVFWVDTVDYLNLAESVKNKFGSAKLFYVHHAWSWKVYINVSDKMFADKWRKGEATFHQKALNFTGYQQKIALLADNVITVTNQATDFFTTVLDIEKDKVKTIYNGIDPPLLNDSDKVAIRKKLGFGENERIVLFSGRVKQDKGVQYLIRAVARLSDKHENIRLILAGNGDFAKFIPLASPHWSRVTYTGGLSVEELKEFYQIADIGVLASMHEQCSYSAIEMRFNRLPLIVSSVDGLDEMFDDGFDALKLTVHYNHNGVRELSEKELAEKLELLLLNEDLRKQLSENGYQKALKYFSAKDMQRKYLAMIKSLVQPFIQEQYIALSE